MSKKTKTPQLRAVDFFCGGGGMTCGMKQAGIDVLLGIDNDDECEDTYIHNNKNTFLCADITTLKTSDLSKLKKIEHTDDDSDAKETKLNIHQNDNNMIFIGCSPCQYYSIISVKKRTQKNIEKNEKGKNLLSDFQRFVDYYRPGFVVIENVPGLETKEGSPLSNFQKFLKENGYKFEGKKINANRYGVPQSRQRFILIASRVVTEIKFPDEDPEPYPTLKTYLEDFQKKYNFVFPALKAGQRDTSEAMHTVAGLEPAILEKLSLHTPKDGGNAEWRNDEKLTIPAYKKSPKSFQGTYGRMAWNKPASTITTKFFGISHGRFGHPEEDRAISLREGASLQTFPPSYVFKTASIGATARLIGNAVPPELARRIGLAILESLKNKKRTKHGNLSSKSPSS